MKILRLAQNTFIPLLVFAVVFLIAGCASSGGNTKGGSASTGDKTTGGGASPNKFTTTDGRTIDIGKSKSADGGTRYDNPHMEKGKCWLAGGFDFNGYDTLYIAPTISTAKFPDKPEDTMVHNLAKERLVSELVFKLNERKIYANVVTREADIKPNAKVLKMENTITEFSKGGGGARFWAGLYGAGQPVLRVQGTDLIKYLSKTSDPSIPAEMKAKVDKFWSAWKDEMKKLLDIVHKLEKTAAKEGYLLAVGLVSGACQLCEKCNVEKGICIHPTIKRFSEEGVGVNVKATAEKTGIKFTLPFDKNPETFALLLID